MSTENMSAEQAADLAALEAQIHDEQTATASAPGEAQPAAPDLAAEVGSIILIAVNTLKPALPSLGEIYTDETVGAASQAIAAVCNKHGWLSGGLFGEYGEEVACAAVILPLGFATWKGVQGDVERAKARHAKQIDAPTPGDLSNVPSPDQKTVIIGQPVPN